MRKFLGGSSGGQPPGVGGMNGSKAGNTYKPEQELLGLNHLKKLYIEYSTPVHPLTDPICQLMTDILHQPQMWVVQLHRQRHQFVPVYRVRSSRLDVRVDREIVPEVA